MADDVAADDYLGPQIYSCLPEGLVSQIATSPSALCTVCAALDLRQYFDNTETRLIPENTAESLIDRHAASLGTANEILQRSDTCGFCQLVVWSLQRYDLEFAQDSPSHLPQDSSRLVSVVIRKSTVAHYRNNDNEKQPVCGIEIGTDEVSEWPFETQERPSIRLLADDAHLLGLKPMYQGRLVGNHVSPSLIRSWIATCEHHHDVCENARYVVRRDGLLGARGLTFIDTKKMCLTKKHAFGYRKYLTLSYVWGGQNGLLLKKDTRSDLSKEGAFKVVWSLLPSVIQDAIELVKAINLYEEEADEDDYLLWVDQLCIVQDDPQDKLIQIEQMGHTFSGATASLVALDGKHCNMPLTRCHIESNAGIVSSEQWVRSIGGLRMLASMPGIERVAEKSTWRTRAWTLQEAELSVATVFFARDQVRFQCAQDVFSEDLVAEIPNSTLDKIKDKEIGAWRNAYLPYGRDFSDEWPTSFLHYAKIAESYSSRNMTFSTDILAAFRGMSSFFHGLSQWRMSNGLIEDVIDASLLWRPKGHLRRRFRSNGNPDNQTNEEDDLRIPTYAWSAWQGHITYAPTAIHLPSLVSRFELRTSKRPRKVVRFSQDPHQLDATLSPKRPFMPSDDSFRESVASTLSWHKSMTRNLAYRARLVNRDHSETTDGPAVLQFHAICLKLVLNGRLVVLEDRDPRPYMKGGKQVYLLDQARTPVGAVWHVPELDQIPDQEVELICLSFEPYAHVSYGEIADPDAWKGTGFINVMLIKRLPDSGLSERLTIGKVHHHWIDLTSPKEFIQLV